MRRAVLGCCLALLLAACGADTELLGNLAEPDANEVVATLLQAGVDARKEQAKEGVQVLVHKADMARATFLLRDAGLPRERRASMGDVFRKEGLISSPLEERARYLWALSQELAETVSQIDGVVKARVHVVLPERATGGEPPTPSSCAVFVKHRPGADIEAVVPQIKRLVANSIPNLDVDKVTVVLVPSTALATAPAAPAKAAPHKTGMASIAPIAAGGVAGLLVVGAVAWTGFTRWRPARKKA